VGQGVRAQDQLEPEEDLAQRASKRIVELVAAASAEPGPDGLVCLAAEPVDGLLLGREVECRAGVGLDAAEPVRLVEPAQDERR
jgi:hypothetical protein